MKQNDRPEIHYHFEFNAPVGQQIAHIDHQDVHFDKDMQMQTLDAVTTAVDEENNPVLEKLLPVFFSNRKEATAFFHAVNNEDPSVITERVNALKREEKVCKSLCKRKLWTILHDANIYPYSESNWNSKLKF